MMNVCICVYPPQETEFELLGRVELHSLLGPRVPSAEATWFIYLCAWLPKALEFLTSLGVLIELDLVTE